MLHSLGAYIFTLLIDEDLQDLAELLDEFFTCIDDGDVRIETDTVFVDEDSTSGECSDMENTIKDNMKMRFGTLIG